MSGYESEHASPAQGEQWSDFRGEVGTILSVDGHQITWKPNNEDAYDGGHPRTYYVQKFHELKFKYVGPPTE